MSLSDLLLERATFFIPILLSLTVHEWAHAWTAWRLGDDTAKLLGRVSLNPIDHIDPVGTLLLPLIGIPFGWAKPVPINPIRFRNSIRTSTGIFLTAAAGPISNFLLAGISLFTLYLFHSSEFSTKLEWNTYVTVTQLLEVLIVINLLLACFNLLPIPPLDGSRIVDSLVTDSLRPLWNRFVALGPFLLVAVILLPILMGENYISDLAYSIYGLIDQVIDRAGYEKS